MIKKKLVRLIRQGPIKIIAKIICAIRSYYYTIKIDTGGGKIVIGKPFLKITIKKGKNARLIVNGKLRIDNHMGGMSAVWISLGNNSTLNIRNDFNIGQGVRIYLNNNSILSFGGKEYESASGITSDTLIMVFKQIDIGTDFLCAWNVFISDSDWHSLGKQKHYQDIKIGNHVWIANSCSILKGTRIGNNCIIASHSKLINSEFSNNYLIGGVPAKEIKADVTWSRDIIEEVI